MGTNKRATPTASSTVSLQPCLRLAPLPMYEAGGKRVGRVSDRGTRHHHLLWLPGQSFSRDPSKCPSECHASFFLTKHPGSEPASAAVLGQHPNTSHVYYLGAPRKRMWLLCQCLHRQGWTASAIPPESSENGFL